MYSDIKQKLLLISIKILTLDYLLIKNVLKKWSPKGDIKVLDLGAGLGNLAPMFSPKNYLGVELDPELVQLAKKDYLKYNFVQGDITTFSNHQKYDLVIVIGVLHHINDRQLEQGLGVISKHLKKDGRAIILEAIPPIYKWNLPGRFIRSLDQGNFIRSYDDYKQKISKKLTVIYSGTKKGGIVDYALFVVTNKSS